MIVKTAYIADDGTVFKNRWECEEYEEKLKQNTFKDTALLFDINGHPLPLTRRGIDNAYYICFKTMEAAEYLYQEFGDYIRGPWDDYGVNPGCWVYICGEEDEWVSFEDLDKRVKELQNKLLFMEGLINS